MAWLSPRTVFGRARSSCTVRHDARHRSAPFGLDTPYTPLMPVAARRRTMDFLTRVLAFPEVSPRTGSWWLVQRWLKGVLCARAIRGDAGQIYGHAG
jgi:hypothetical protein